MAGLDDLARMLFCRVVCANWASSRGVSFPKIDSSASLSRLWRGKGEVGFRTAVA